MAVERLVKLVVRYQERLNRDSLTDILRDLIKAIGYESELRRLYPNPDEHQSRLDAVGEVVNAMASYESKARKPTLLGFLDEVVLGDRDFSDDKDKQLQRDAVVLMTMHSAKGLEFPHVYLVGMEEGILPHHRSLDDDRNVDEERRLCYVGVTRAQERLTLSFPLVRMKWGQPRETVPSRFLYELSGQADNPHEIAQRQKAIRERSRQSRKKVSGRAANASSTRKSAGSKKQSKRSTKRRRPS
jgi:DNA helicase-2/ATP-dependent DNA helicase PcrA